MTERHNAPRRYFVDAQGKRVLIGLSLPETAEFEALDITSGETVQIGPGDGAAAAHEARWLELYSKHEGAWRAWIVQSQAEQPQDSSFVNYV
ncbi:hypothetical protein ABIB75_005359 [Bradyrhizobium sp. GM2.2]|jgi:hypothetical protein|uniref:Uncharacterized protein n=1 Tax=Bradyrhizobium canariense TaxID=255045 RepID=A0A1X3FS67_9BRAD|nr:MULTISPECIES: hypothetical protein [Bradyrhizobium]MBM7488371.1 hypothetical protein [Bradyrhizobium canariense]MCK1269296.1 hypothetical protein [Bradyrhizobium sp. 84]MCK1294819.1 hypothetical protein [Bradyrhizobium sp. 30]MCK1305174.1 hypothetical protein [Bradyrhizobium sp. 45]MCK1317409.1 hypothetical protein [Bradyrhizobium sp. 23]